MPPEYKAYNILNQENGTWSELKLDIPGISYLHEDDEKGKAAVNIMFAKVSAHVPPLNVANFPTYLQVKDPVPQLYL